MTSLQAKIDAVQGFCRKFNEEKDAQGNSLSVSIKDSLAKAPSVVTKAVDELEKLFDGNYDANFFKEPDHFKTSQNIVEWSSAIKQAIIQNVIIPDSKAHDIFGLISFLDRIMAAFNPELDDDIE